MSGCVTVVLASHHLSLLDAFTRLSLAGVLPAWGARLIVITRLSPISVGSLAGVLATTDAVLLHVHEEAGGVR